MQPFARREIQIWERVVHLSPNVENTQAHGFENNLLLQNSVTGCASWGMPALKRFAQQTFKNERKKQKKL